MSPPAIKSTGNHTGSPLHAGSDLDTNIRLILMRLPYPSDLVQLFSKRRVV